MRVAVLFLALTLGFFVPTVNSSELPPKCKEPVALEDQDFCAEVYELEETAKALAAFKGHALWIEMLDGIISRRAAEYYDPRKPPIYSREVIPSHPAQIPRH